MGARPELTEQEILQRMHERVNAAGRHFAADPATVLPAGFGSAGNDSQPVDLSRLGQDVQLAYVLHGAVGTINPRGRGLHNKLIQLIKRIMARMLSWYSRPIQQFQAAAARSLQGELRALLSLQDRVYRHIERLDTELDALRTLRLEERLRNHELKLRRLDAVSQAPQSGQPITAVAGSLSPSPTPLEFDYSLFEEFHRGPETLIKERQQKYVRYFEGEGPVWDLGCGRGEFLELLRESAIPAHGVETNRDAYHRCQEKGLSVTQQNLFDFLERAEDNSAGGIFAAQVIEHLPVELQLKLVHLTFRKLRPNSPLLLETINPECLFALTRNFYLDPSHIRPVHPEMLRFALESTGFRDVKVHFSGPVEGKFLEKPTWETAGDLQELTKALMTINHFVFGFQDYYILGWRS